MSRQHPATTQPPWHEVAHLGHIELLTPEPDASLRFFVDILGLTETGRDSSSVYLRTWDDYEDHTVKLTAHDTSGIKRVGLRAFEPGRPRGPGGGDQDDRARRRLEGRRSRYRAHLPVPRSGRARAASCTGKRSGIPAPDELRPSLKNQAQAYPGRGGCVGAWTTSTTSPRTRRRTGPAFAIVLGGGLTEQIMLDDGTISAQWLHFTNKGYDLAYTRDWDRHARTTASRRVHAGHPRGYLARGGHLAWTAVSSSRPGRTSTRSSRRSSVSRNRRTGREPDRAVQPGRPAGPGPGLAHDHLDGGGAGQGPGVGLRKTIESFHTHKPPSASADRRSRVPRPAPALSSHAHGHGGFGSTVAGSR